MEPDEKMSFSDKAPGCGCLSAILLIIAVVIVVFLSSCTKQPIQEPDLLYNKDSCTFVIDRIETHIIIENWGTGIWSYYPAKIPAYRPSDGEYIWGRRFVVYTRIDNDLLYSGWDYVCPVNYCCKDSLYQDFIQINNPWKPSYSTFQRSGKTLTTPG